MNSSICVFVVAYKKFEKLNLPGYKVIYTKPAWELAEEEDLIDKIEDGIYDRNLNWSEYTAFYYVWKNIKCDIVGMCHYRRYLLSENDQEILTINQVSEILENYDVIVPRKFQFKKTLGEWFIYSSGYKKDLLLLRKILKDKYSDYLGAFDFVINGYVGHYHNIMIMHKELFDKYCEFVFDILTTMESLVDLSGYTIQEQRIFGYLGELLFNVWLVKNNMRIKELDILNTEQTNMSLKLKIKRALIVVIKRIIYFPYGVKPSRLK